MHRTVMAFLAFLAIFSGYEDAVAQDVSRGNVNVLLGQRNLNEDDWKPVEQQPVFAVEVDYAGVGWPVSVLSMAPRN